VSGTITAADGTTVLMATRSLLSADPRDANITDTVIEHLFAVGLDFRLDYHLGRNNFTLNLFAPSKYHSTVAMCLLNVL
jgi:hypothetical protein